jgi:hypothetical protein
MSARKHYHRVVTGICDYAKEDGAHILGCIELITQNGGAIRLGKTRDGGCYSIGVYGDGQQPYTDYLRPGESLAEYFSDLATAFASGVAAG